MIVKVKSRNARGNSKARKRRREWMMQQFGMRCQGGIVVVCVHCGVRCRASGKGWEVDRRICGHSGGRYNRANLQVACRTCNRGRCNKHRTQP